MMTAQKSHKVFMKACGYAHASMTCHIHIRTRHIWMPYIYIIFALIIAVKYYTVLISITSVLKDNQLNEPIYSS